MCNCIWDQLQLFQIRLLKLIRKEFYLSLYENFFAPSIWNSKAVPELVLSFLDGPQAWLLGPLRSARMLCQALAWMYNMDFFPVNSSQMVSLNTMLRILTGKIPRNYDRPLSSPVKDVLFWPSCIEVYVEFSPVLAAGRAWQGEIFLQEFGNYSPYNKKTLTQGSITKPPILK